MTEETADAWIAAWEAQAPRDGVERASVYWERAYDWIASERQHRLRP